MTAPSLRNGRPFTVTVRFHSDWMCGTGAGRHGAVDRQVQRDSDGFPLVRGKALAAVLRDAAETVATGLDEGGSGVWHEWLELLFGDQPAVQGDRIAAAGPRSASLIARTLRLPDGDRAAITGRTDAGQVADAMVVLRSGVRIDPVTGVAADDMLRFEERARAGLTVTGRWQIRMAHLGDGVSVPWEAELLLLASAKVVEAIGGKRRRGAGRCSVDIAVPGAHASARLTELLTMVDDARAPSSPTAPVVQPGALGAWDGDRLRLRHELRITALSPLVMSQGVRGNVVLTEQFVPGTLLLPLVAKALGGAATELITAGRVVVTNATVEIDGRRSSPAPQVLQVEKGAGGGVMANLLHPEGTTSRKSAGVAGFCVPVGDGLRVEQPRLVEQAHAVIDDQQQRPNEVSGGLFVYQAIAAGTVLRAQVWAPDGVHLSTDLLEGERELGRSRKDDYGHVRITVDPSPPDDELGVGVDAANGGAELVVWVLSDVLLRGANGEPDPSVTRFAEVLGEALGVTLRGPDTASRAVAYTGIRRVESWQTRWGLPRPSLVGIRGGSVVRFTVDGAVDRAAWARVEANGVGDRTPEGFGRVALNPDVLRPASVVRAGGSDIHALLVTVWRHTVRQSVMARAGDPTRRAQIVPPDATSAQLGTVRTLADRLAADLDTTAVLAWISATRSVGARRTVWGQQRLDRLDRLINGSDELWDWLGVTPEPAVAEQLRAEALAMVLAEVARAEVRAKRALATSDVRDDHEERP